MAAASRATNTNAYAGKVRCEVNTTPRDAGMKIAGGLALIGTVVAEFAAGSGTSTGLAWRIAEASNRLQIAKVFAALALLSAIGIAIYALLSLLEWYVLKDWHESARPKE